MKRTAPCVVLGTMAVLASGVLAGCTAAAPPDESVQRAPLTSTGSIDLDDIPDGSPCVAGELCKVDLQGCTEDQKASAWKGQFVLAGTLQLAFYTSHKNWVCQTSIPQAWPVVPEPGWWCGTVVEHCVCSPSDGCF